MLALMFHVTDVASSLVEQSVIEQLERECRRLGGKEATSAIAQAKAASKQRKSSVSSSREEARSSRDDGEVRLTGWSETEPDYVQLSESIKPLSDETVCPNTQAIRQHA